MNCAGWDVASSGRYVYIVDRRGREAEGRDTDRPERTGAHTRWIFDTVKNVKMNPTG